MYLGLMRFELGYFSSLTNITNMVGVYFVYRRIHACFGIFVFLVREMISKIELCIFFY
jgi:hypothetical protein